jgi:hypothetical protein
MKTAKLFLILVIIVSLLTFILVACDWDDNGGSGGRSGESTHQPRGNLAYDLTATYGADQFHAQLTAIAEICPVGKNQLAGSSEGNP